MVSGEKGGGRTALYERAVHRRTTSNTSQPGKLNMRASLNALGQLALCGGQVLDQPVGNDFGHSLKIIAFRELMIGAGHQLQVFLDS